MHTSANSDLSIAIASCAHLLKGGADDYDPLLELIGDARFVLLGEASHGTHEFYRERARITQRLIAEKGFTAVAVEADWPDAWRVNRYVRGIGGDADAAQALAGFRRFPTWMWRNTEVVDFVEWLRRRNASLPPQADAAGFYGLDLYSLFTSIDEVLRYLDQTAPETGRRARQRYACFDHFGEDSQRYGYVAAFNLSASCEEAAVTQLRELQARAAEHAGADDGDPDTHFYIEQNARLVANAEQYYRTMFRGRVSSWNLRDRHMADTLQALEEHLTRGGGQPAKIVVWEHNSHIGDARATEVGEQGEWTVGQLARETWGEQTRLIGFTTHHGTVTAASDWDAPAERKQVRPALPGSYEELFHQVGMRAFYLPLRGHRNPAAQALAEGRLERAIGVIYRPESERQSHYFYAQLPQQFDAILHFDETRALEPLEYGSHWHTREVPETFPAGL